MNDHLVSIIIAWVLYHHRYTEERTSYTPQGIYWILSMPCIGLIESAISHVQDEQMAIDDQYIKQTLEAMQSYKQSYNTKEQLDINNIMNNVLDKHRTVAINCNMNGDEEASPKGEYQYTTRSSTKERTKRRETINGQRKTANQTTRTNKDKRQRQRDQKR
eukprot:697096_1